MNKQSESKRDSFISVYKLAGFGPWYFIPPLVIEIVATFAEVGAYACLVPAVQVLTGSTLEFPPFLERMISMLPGYTVDSSTHLAFLLFGMVFLLMIVKNILKILSVNMLSWKSLEFSNRLRKELFGKLITYGPLFYRVNGRNSPISCINIFAYELSSRIATIVRGVGGILSVLSFVILLFYLSPTLMTIGIITIPILYYIQGFILKKLRASSQTEIATRDALVRFTRNFFDNFEFVVVSNAEKAEQERFNHLSDVTSVHNYSVAKKQQCIPFVNEAFFIIIMMGMMLVMWLVSNRFESRGVENYGIFIIALKRSTHYINTITRLKVTLILLETTVEHINRVFYPEKDFAIKSGTEAIPLPLKNITFDNVSFKYPGNDRLVLDSISFSVPEGKMTALVGRTGAGKSTLLQLMLRFMDPSDGDIRINDTSLRELDYAAWRDSIAYVSQETYLFDATIYENCVFGLNPVPSREEVMEALTHANLDELIDSLPNGLDTDIGERGIRLSGGERQRLSISRAILKKARLIFLDEATSALDSKTERSVHSAIVRLSEGRTLVVIAHRLSTIQDSDHVIVIEEGKVAETGSIEELLDHEGIFHQYWQQNNLDAKSKSV